MKANARLDQAVDELRGQVSRSPAVHHHVDRRTVAGGGDQALVQLPPDFVVEENERFQQDFPARGRDHFEGAWVELLAVLQQREPVAGHPFQAHS